MVICPEDQRTLAREKYHRKREFETSEEREQRNQKRRARYIEKKLIAERNNLQYCTENQQTTLPATPALVVDGCGNQEITKQTIPPSNFGDCGSHTEQLITTDMSATLQAENTIIEERYRQRSDFEINEQRDIQIIVEKSLSDILAEKRRLERNEQRREKYKQRKLQSEQLITTDMSTTLQAENTTIEEIYRQRSDFEINEQRNVQIIVEKSLSDILAEKRRLERNEQRREKYKQRKLQSGNNSDLHCDASKIIIRPTLQFSDFPLLTKNMRTRINNRKRSFALRNDVLDIGCADKIFCHCGALMWRFEQTQEQQRLNSDKFSLCCSNGKVLLPLLRETPPELKLLLDGTNNKSATFRKNSRLYNNAFAFTSVGANLDNTINNGGGPFVYRALGIIYHQIGTLFPEESTKAVFSQIYMYDNEQQFEQRLKFPKNEDQLDTEIINSLSSMLQRENAWVDIYRHVRDKFKDSEIAPATIRLVANRETDGRETNIPTNAYEFAGLIANDNLSDDRDIVVYPKDAPLRRISVLHPSYMSLQYPLIFPFGEDGYRLNILHAGITIKTENKRDLVSIRQYYCYRIQHRNTEGHTLIGGGRLFLQFVVDAWACIEHTRLTWVLKNQAILRSDLYNNVVDSVNMGDNIASMVGKRIVLPSSFTGSPRYMQQNYQDCMAICRRYGSPDLFITFTCNPQWPEIKKYCDMVPQSDSTNRPDVLARVFKIKLDLLLEDLTENHVLGKVIGVAYTIEFQKRGLPHAHIIVWLEESDKCHTTDEIDDLICAEIPDKTTDPVGYDAISKYMIHGPCGAYNQNCPCMRDGKCTKYYPKDFRNETTIDSNGYPVYRRRDDKRTIQVKDITIDNRFIVPYNRGLIVKYQAHINIEWCTQGRLIKYMFKYVTKGPDRATIAVEKVKDRESAETIGNVNTNEVHDYVACCYVSSAEACWRIYDFPIHNHKPVVVKLVFHEENQHQICFREDEQLQAVLDRIDPNATMFMQWFEANKEYASAKQLTFVEFPQKFLWNESGKIWTCRKNNIRVIGRLIYVHPTAGERFYLRMLLGIVRGATSFEEIRTVNNVVYNTYKEACFHHGLLESDDEWHAAITDASVHQTGAQLRELFVTLLLFCEISDVRALWDKHWRSFSDDIELKQRKGSTLQNFVIGEDQLECLTLHDVDMQLRKTGKTLSDFPTLPELDHDLHRQSRNTLLYEESMYDMHALSIEGEKCRQMLNEKQTVVFEAIIDNVKSKVAGLFFVYGHGGTGKTFLWKTIINNLRSQEKIVLAVASSSIASLLIQGGRTAHSRFKIPIDISENSTCDIKQQSFLAELIVQTDLIIWDEAPMNHKHIFEAVDRSIRDLMRHQDATNLDKPFGGKTVLLGGDFRQILPVLPKKGREDIVMASINRSYLWNYCTVFRLDKNMRLDSGIPPVTLSGQQFPYVDWVIAVGDGQVPTISTTEGSEPYWIEIPPELLIDPKDNGKQVIIDIVYSEWCNSSDASQYFRDRAILTPLNEDVDKINKEVLERFPGQSRVYRSMDSICKTTVNYESLESMYPLEYLNTVRVAGIPNHELN